MNIAAARELHLDTFRHVFKRELKQEHQFGTNHQGIDDGKEGVQWNAWADWSGNGQFSGYCGVNLEGKEYDGWPVARLIERELGSFALFNVIADVDNSDEIMERWSRDAWGPGGSRLALQEHQILNARLSELTGDRDKWRTKLVEAQGCLKSKEGGRGRQEVTVGNTRSPQWVTPHLGFSRELWSGEQPSEALLVERMQDVRRQLQPLHRAMVDLSKDPKVILAEAQRDIEAMKAEERYVEGERSRVLVNRYERDSALRAKAIEIHGTTCQGCRFSFEAVYGDHGSGYIEVHHLKPLASYDGPVTVDPRADMAVLCSNCHRMVHRRLDSFSAPFMRGGE